MKAALKKQDKLRKKTECLVSWTQEEKEMLLLSWKFWEEVGQTSGTTKSMLGPAPEAS